MIAAFLVTKMMADAPLNLSTIQSSQEDISVITEILYETDTTDITGKELIKQIDFWLLFFIHLTITGTGLMWKNLLGSITSAFQSRNAILFVYIFSISNSILRLLVGFFADITAKRIPRPAWLLLFTMFAIIGQSSYFYLGKKSLLLIDVSTAFAYGCDFCIVGMLTNMYFGVNHYGLNFGFISLASAVSVPLMTFLATKESHFPVKECYGRECYWGAILMASAVLSVGFLLCLPLTVRHIFYRDSQGASRSRTTTIPNHHHHQRFQSDEVTYYSSFSSYPRC